MIIPLLGEKNKWGDIRLLSADPKEILIDKFGIQMYDNKTGGHKLW
jgi:hypothetical protein